MIATATAHLQARIRSRWATAVLLAGVAAYLVLALTNLNLPGAHYDEAADAVPAMELLHGQYPASALKSITVFGQPVPIMMLHYIGPTSIYTSLLGFAALGVSIEALRLTQTLIGLLTLVLLTVVSRAWFDDGTAALAALLTASAPAFVWWNRAGVFFASPLLPLALSLLLLLTRWRRTGKPAFLIAASFVFGLGAVTKLLFVWLLVPIALTAVLACGWKDTLRSIRSLSATTSLLCILAFSLGFAPFLLHNMPGLDSFRFVAENVTRSQLYGHNNLDFFNNLRFEATEFFRLVGGDTLEFNAPAVLPLTGVALIVCVIYTSAWLTRQRRAKAPTWTPRLFLLLSILTLVPLGTFSVTSIGGRHLFILLPFSGLLIAACLADGLRLAFDLRSQPILKRLLRLRAGIYAPTSNAELSQPSAQDAYATHCLRRWLKVVAVGLLLALAANQLLTNVTLHRFFVETGGRGLWSDAINRTAELLQGQFAGRPAIAMDWGFERNLAIVTNGRVRLREAYEFTPSPSPKFEDVSTVLLRESGNVYLFHAPGATAFGGHWELFERAALKSRKQLVLEAALRERDGVTNTLIYTAQPATRNFSAPDSSRRRDATFDNGLTLLDGDVNYDPAKRELAVNLLWQSNADALAADTVLLHVVNPADGEVVVVADKQPVYGSYPFDQWQRGEVVRDPHWVALPASLAPGVYQVRIGVYDPVTGVRRAINDPQNDAAGNSLMLQTFEIK